MNLQDQKTIRKLIETGGELKSESAFIEWRERVKAYIRATMDEESVAEFEEVSDNDRWWGYNRGGAIGYLEGLADRLNDINNIATYQEKVVGDKDQDIMSTNVINANKVFVVHGHDNEAKELVSRFLEKIGLNPIILHEQPNSGRTVIEKFEAFADVKFAVVLLTPDDIGGTSKSKLAPRARQNVILELGYFIGKLSRKRVCTLYKPGVEIPSDYQGVLYIEMDSSGGWKTQLAQEIVSAGIEIELGGLLQ